MNYTKTAVGTTWTKIASSATNISFQNLTSYPIMITCTEADVAPAESVTGIHYNTFQGETKKPLSELSYLAAPAYVWAKSAAGRDSVVAVEAQ
jgi:hypothetical protein